MFSSRRAELGILVLALACVTGCSSSPRRVALTDAQLQERSDTDLAETRQTFHDAISRLLDRTTREVAEQTSATPAVVDILALSGGGDYGAFGAGFLVGWGQVADPAARRPEFDAVTGVSTGALLAPFAYLGTDEACLQVESFYRSPKKDWVLDRGILYFLPYKPSFMVIPGLQRDVCDTIDLEFIGKLAEESRKGKVLAISATDLDFGRQKFWNVGAEAEAAVANGDPDRVHRMFFASSAIPAVFPPIEIDDHLYADGGVTANVFLRLDPRSPDAFVPRWRAMYPDKPMPRVRYWIIINNQLNQPPKTVQVRWPAVMGPSLASAIRSATLAEVRWLAAQADFVNVVFKTDIEVRVVAIPDDWRAPVSGDFKRETMESLSDLGRKMGADPSSWRVWATPDDLATLTGAAP